MSDENTRARRERKIKVRKEAKHYGQGGGAHRVKKGAGSYRRPHQARWDSAE